MAGPRKQRTEPFDILPGLFMNETARGAKRRWRDGDNTRWYDGLPEKMNGFQELIVRAEDDEDTDPGRRYRGRARSCLEWDSLDGQHWFAFGTHCKLYLVGNDLLYDITPVRRTSTMVDGFATQIDSDLVTVTDPMHDANDGDHVRFFGATEVGGVTIEGEYRVVSVIDLDNYTVRAASLAIGTAVGGGTVRVEYDLPCGLETDGTLAGYGTGPYGEGTYGTERENSTFGGFARVWSLDNWGEDLLASPNGETLFVWERRLGPSSRAKYVSGAPANIEHMLVGPDDRHVIAFGANLASTGRQDKMFVRWCVGDDYQQWLATGQNDAGSKRLDIGSRLISALKTRQGILIWSDKGLYWLSVVGGQNVYAIESMGESLELISKRAAVDVRGTVYMMTTTEFFMWDGVLAPLPCDVREYIFGTPDLPGINRLAQSKVHCTHVQEFNEVRWEFPAGDSLENNRVAIYNTVERCWYVSSMAREAYADRGKAFGFPVGLSGGRIWLHENGVNAGVDDVDQQPVALPAFLESYESEYGAGEYTQLLNHLIPDFKRLTGSVQVTVFGRDYPGASRRSISAGEVTASTERIDSRFRGRQVGLRVESSEVGDDWRMGQWRTIAGPIGAR